MYYLELFHKQIWYRYDYLAMFPIMIIVKVSQIFVTFTVRKVVTCNNSMQDEKMEIWVI